MLFTQLEKDLVSSLEAKCKEINVPSLSIIVLNGKCRQTVGGPKYAHSQKKWQATINATADELKAAPEFKTMAGGQTTPE